MLQYSPQSASIAGMPGRGRIEVGGGLYHIITRGVDRQDIFHSPEDHARFLGLLAGSKERLPFYLYAFCLMTNHVHLLVERRQDPIGRIMHRVLTGYSQYYNRKYRRSGHLLQGRHKAILCQSDMYLAELVRYIHLNPVRAKMVRKAEEYPYSSHRAYMGLGRAGVVDVDSVLRRFGPKKAVARERFAKHVAAGMRLGHQAALYETRGGVLGSEEFIDATIHRIGEFGPKGTPGTPNADVIDAEDLVSAVVKVCGVAREDLCGKAKGRRLVAAKEMLILAGRRAGLSATALSGLTGLSIATVSRRHDRAICRSRDAGEWKQLSELVTAEIKARDGSKSSK